ncbi:hypothetical protein M422DRAFT_244562 [Sphaerobolus stellatus SS14]|nr:hypothetical protein M422DRAFT_244562 [Sphaerobolus stellatus SS14]
MPTVLHRSQYPERRGLVNISAPISVRREVTPEIQNILEAMNQELPGGLPDDLKRRLLSPAAAIPLHQPDRPSVFVTEPTKANHRASPTSTMTISDHDSDEAPSCFPSLRSCFSSPDLRAPPSKASLPRRSKSPAPPTRQQRPLSNAFSVNTEIIQAKRPVLRRLLDAGGCTKSENFDISDFQRVKVQQAQIRTSRAANTAGVPLTGFRVSPPASPSSSNRRRGSSRQLSTIDFEGVSKRIQKGNEEFENIRRSQQLPRAPRSPRSPKRSVHKPVPPTITLTSIA